MQLKDYDKLVMQLKYQDKKIAWQLCSLLITHQGKNND